MRLLLALFASLIAVPAHAQTEPPPPTPPGQAPAQPAANLIADPVGVMIAGFDADQDGRVTRAEFDAGVRRSFELADTQHRGSISFIGFSDWAETWLGNRNALPGPFEVDKDGDNRITLAELTARFDLFFSRFDVNKDGVIVRSELVRVGPPQMIRFDGRRRRDGQQQDQ